MGKYKQCNHVMASGGVCGNVALDNSNFCYWHHKLRTRQRHRHQLGGPVHEAANTGINLPSLDDANAIQIAIEEIAHAVIDRRIDSKRAGLLLYAMQLASSNAKELTIASEKDEIGAISEENVVNDALDPDEDEDGEHSSQMQA